MGRNASPKKPTPASRSFSSRLTPLPASSPRPSALTFGKPLDECSRRCRRSAVGFRAGRGRTTGGGRSPSAASELDRLWRLS
ncbi:hypothetical protein NBRC10513_003633 [Rhodotorula toruloides]